MRKINGIEIVATAFAYDGCHKIYLLNDGDSIVEAEDAGFDVYDIGNIISAFVYACPLRFINEWGGEFKTIVPQGADEITFEGFEISEDLDSFDYEIVISESGCVLKRY